MTDHVIIDGSFEPFPVCPEHLQMTGKDNVKGISWVSLVDYDRIWGIALDLRQGCQVFHFILRKFFKQGTSPQLCC
jgi:hypothetical protein